MSIPRFDAERVRDFHAWEHQYKRAKAAVMKVQVSLGAVVGAVSWYVVHR